MINKIDKEMRRSINTTQHDPPTRSSGKEPKQTQDRAQGRARADQSLKTLQNKKYLATDKELKENKQTTEQQNKLHLD
jgi:hypothetical protein